MYSRRGQGISVNVIIIAAIALVVMVILIALVLQSSDPLDDVDQCTSTAGAMCLDQFNAFDESGNRLNPGTCPEGYAPAGSLLKCADTDRNPNTAEWCCIPLGN